MANNVIKLTYTTPDTYRNLIKHFKEKGIYYHTYQLKEERAYRVVLKYLHHTTEVEDIRQRLFALERVARNIVNVHHRLTKEPLNLFFIGLDPAINNKDIYNITAIQNKIIHIEMCFVWRESPGKQQRLRSLSQYYQRKQSTQNPP